MERLRLKQKKFELNGAFDANAEQEIASEKALLDVRYKAQQEKLAVLYKTIKRDSVQVKISNGTIVDFLNFVKLAYMAPAMNHSGGTVCEPVDIPVNKRHFDMLYAHMKYSDKPFMGSVTHPERAQNAVAMCEILFGK